MRGRLYLVGGGVVFGSRFAVSGVEVYDIELDQWSAVLQSDPSTLPYAAASFVRDNKIYILGG